MPKLCKMTKKNLEKELDEYIKLVDEPKCLCVKCGRASNKKSNVCKPKSFN